MEEHFEEVPLLSGAAETGAAHGDNFFALDLGNVAVIVIPSTLKEAASITAIADASVSKVRNP